MIVLGTTQAPNSTPSRSLLPPHPAPRTLTPAATVLEAQLTMCPRSGNSNARKTGEGCGRTARRRCVHRIGDRTPVARAPPPGSRLLAYSPGCLRDTGVCEVPPPGRTATQRAEVLCMHEQQQSRCGRSEPRGHVVVRAVKITQGLAVLFVLSSQSHLEREVLVAPTPKDYYNDDSF